MASIQTTSAEDLNAGIVHDWFPVIGGGERVVQQLANAFPNCSLYALFDFLSDEDRRELVGDRPIHVSGLNSLPKVESYYRYLLLQCARSVEKFDLSAHDIVVSSSAALAKGVITAPGQPHIAYVHSPARYAWDLTHEYIGSMTGAFSGIKRALAHELMHRFRIWDMRTPPSIDMMLANSGFISQRIAKIYRRQSMVVYPPVNTDDFTPVDTGREEFYLTASRLVPYKRIDMIVRAFAARPDKKLVVIGDGPEMAKVKAAAGPNVEILGYQSFDVLRDHMQRAKAFIFGALEDFGIVPIEAQACGTPVIALGQGGTAETVRPVGQSDRPTGVWFHEQTEEDLLTAIDTFEARQDEITVQNCRDNALSFGADRFRREMRYIVERGNQIGFDELLAEGLPKDLS